MFWDVLGCFRGLGFGVSCFGNKFRPSGEMSDIPGHRHHSRSLTPWQKASRPGHLQERSETCNLGGPKGTGILSDSAGFKEISNGIAGGSLDFVLIIMLFLPAAWHSPWSFISH